MPSHARTEPRSSPMSASSDLDSSRRGETARRAWWVVGVRAGRSTAAERHEPTTANVARRIEARHRIGYVGVEKRSHFAPRGRELKPLSAAQPRLL